MDITHKDFFGMNIDVGDLVLYPNGTGWYTPGFGLGTVVKLNQKSVVIKTKTNRRTRRHPDTLIKPTDEQLFMRGIYKKL